MGAGYAVMGRSPMPRSLPLGGALPAVTLVVVVVGAALASLIATSLGLTPVVGDPALSGEAFRSTAADVAPGVTQSLLLAVPSSLAAGLIGLLAATVVLARPGRRGVMLGIAGVVVAIPHVVGAVDVAMLLSDSGFAARIVENGGGEFPELVAADWPIAAAFELAWKESAFVTLVVVGALAGRHEELIDTAAVLGAGRVQRWRRVVVPMARPSAQAATLIVLVYSAGVYEVPRLLNSAYPETLSVLSYRLFGSIDLASRPQAAAVAVTALGLAMTIGLVGAALLPRGVRR